ncbi:hypothetical protein [Lichenicoccus sp.]|uniref:hypothetical protein n=1 Tax=Lichenicoccus sp. TaxID=2781899 RepID=UPI003D15078D
MNKALVLLYAAVCYGGTTGPMAAAAPVHEWNPDDTLPTSEDVASAAARARSTHCESPACKAIILINELVDIEKFQDGDANGVASLFLGKRPHIAGRRLDQVLLTRPALCDGCEADLEVPG